MNDNAIRKKRQREKTAKCRAKIKENNPAKHEATKVRNKETTSLWYANKIRNMTAEQLAVYRQSRAAAARRNWQKKKLMTVNDELEIHDEITIAKSVDRERLIVWRKKLQENNANYKAYKQKRNSQDKRKRLTHKILSIYPETALDDLVPKPWPTPQQLLLKEWMQHRNRLASNLAETTQQTMQQTTSDMKEE